MTDQTLREWMEHRFDRIDERVDVRFNALAEELKSTRHGLRPLIEQLAVQLAELVTVSRQHDREIVQVRDRAEVVRGELLDHVEDINDYLAPEGPLDKRLKRHVGRIETVEGWRNSIMGQVALLAALFVLTVPAIIAVTR